jgi:hypothetical protein
MPTLAGIEYAVSTDSFRKGIDNNGPYYNVDLIIEDWADSDDFGNALMGLGNNTIPHENPLSPRSYASGVAIEGFGEPVLNTNGLPEYDEGAIVHVTYRPSAYAGLFRVTDDPENVNQIDPGTPLTFAVQDLDFDSERITIPGENHKLKWLGSGKKADVPLSVEIGLTTMVLNFTRARFLPIAFIRECRGKVNGPGPAITTPQLILPANTGGTFLGAVRGTVLFKGAKTKMEAATNGSVQKSIQMIFVEREQPWGRYITGESLDEDLRWDFLVDGSGNKQFIECDMRQLIYYSSWVAA